MMVFQHHSGRGVGNLMEQPPPESPPVDYITEPPPLPSVPPPPLMSSKPPVSFTQIVGICCSGGMIIWASLKESKGLGTRTTTYVNRDYFIFVQFLLLTGSMISDMDFLLYLLDNYSRLGKD